MDDKDKQRFRDIMMGVADNFRDTITTEGMRMRFKMLAGYTINQVEAAAEKILKERKYLKIPPVAEFIEAIQGNSPKQIEDQAEIQATYVISQIGKRSVKFDDPITKHLMTERWKWSSWAPNIIEAELKWWAKEFKEAYQAFSGSETPLHIEAPENVGELMKGIGNESTIINLGK